MDGNSRLSPSLPHEIEPGAASSLWRVSGDCRGVLGRSASAVVSSVSASSSGTGRGDSAVVPRLQGAGAQVSGKNVARFQRLILPALVSAGLARLQWGQSKRGRADWAFSADNLSFSIAPMDKSLFVAAQLYAALYTINLGILGPPTYVIEILLSYLRFMSSSSDSHFCDLLAIDDGPRDNEGPFHQM